MQRLARPFDGINSGHVFLSEVAEASRPGNVSRYEARRKWHGTDILLCPDQPECDNFRRKPGVRPGNNNVPKTCQRGGSFVKKEVRLNAFAMNCVAHQSPGLWTHPRDRTADYNRLPYWIDLAKTLERGRFDGLFLADVLGVYDVFGGSPDAAPCNATQTPCNDPLLLISAMAAVTEHLGFGVTSNLSYEPPYTFARRMSTLDHLTEGRIGWNVVTGYLDSAAKGAGKDKQTAHDDRYDVADRIYGGGLQALGRKLGGRRGAARSGARHLRRSRKGASHLARRKELSRRCHSPLRPSPQRTPVLYRPAPRRADGSSPPSMPNAFSCRDPRPRSSPRAFPPFANWRGNPGATRPTY